MSAGMAEVIAAHGGHSVKLSPQGRFTVQCHGCGESTSVSRVTPPPSGSPIHAAHVAEELAKAGYGTAQTAQVEAWSEGWAAGLLDASIPGRKESTNPYSEPQHG